MAEDDTSLRTAGSISGLVAGCALLVNDLGALA